MVVVAFVAVVGSAEAAADDTEAGGKIYKQFCSYCHDDGQLGAPRIGDPAAWAPILNKDRRNLVAVAWKGESHNNATYNMPARMIRKELTEQEVEAAVDFMLDAVKSGRTKRDS